MSIKIKSGGAYANVVGVSEKKNGAYASVVGLSAKVAGAYVLATAPAVPTAVYLPSVGSSPVAAYGMRRMVSTYLGALLQVQRASDNATMDVAQGADGLANNAAVVTWAGGSQVRLRQWYDQTGNARHALQATFSNMPLYDAAGLRGQATAFNAFKSAVFDGWLDVPSGNIRRPKKLTLPNGVAYNFQAHSIFLVIDPKSALYNSVYLAVPRTADGSEATAVGTASSVSGVYTSGGGGNSTARRIRQNYQTLGLVSGAAAFKFFQDGLIVSGSPKWTDPLQGGILGDGIYMGGSGDFMSYENMLGFVVYPAALSDANAGLVRDALNSTYGISAPTGAQIVQVGDSLMYGPTVNESLEARTPTRQVRALLNGNAALYNFGLSSQLLTGGGGLAASASSREFAVVDVAFANRILYSEIGGNDIAANGGVAGYATTLYAAYSSYITAARAAGFTKIVLRTILPRAQGTQNNIELAAFNNLIRANSAGADAISDVAAHPIMGNAANIGNLVYYQGDNVHPTSAGNELIAPIDAAAINSVM